MIGRSFIRIKVMQAIYAYHVSNANNMEHAKKHLLTNFSDLYDLYLSLITLFDALAFHAEKVIEKKKQKYLPSESDLKPNMKFVDNQFINKIQQNTDLQALLRARNLTWYNDINMLFIKDVYNQLSNHEVFIEYMQSPEHSFSEDKQFILNVTEKFFLGNEMMNNYFGDLKLHWLHDYNDAVLLVYHTLKNWSEKQSNDKKMPSIFKIEADGTCEDRQLVIDLFDRTLQHDKEYTSIIANNIRNWEIDRIALLDAILLKMAICEFCEFPSIPIRVTMNEYIEISKYYSTPKSRNFINGLLDKILSELKEENKINKQGRGLMG